MSEIGKTPAVFPWKPPVNPTTSVRFVNERASRIPASTASAPPLKNCVRESSPGATPPPPAAPPPAPPTPAPAHTPPRPAHPAPSTPRRGREGQETKKKN